MSEAVPLRDDPELHAIGLSDLTQTRPLLVALHHRRPDLITADGNGPLLPLLATTPDPEPTLRRLIRLVDDDRAGTSPTELARHPERLRRLVTIAAWPEHGVDVLQSHPGLLHDIEAALLRGQAPLAQLTTEARELTRGCDDPGASLLRFQAREHLAIAIRDVEGGPRGEAPHAMAAVAVAVLRALVDHATDAMAAEHGLPVTESEAPDPDDEYAATNAVAGDTSSSALEGDTAVSSQQQTGFSIIGLGKLGGSELSYGSDLDIMFVSQPGGRCPRTGRDGEWFWTKVAQRVMRVAKAHRLYEIDPRLRPWGDQGELVASTNNLALYWGAPRDLWERLAMTRLYPVCGSRDLGREAAAVICRGVFTDHLPDQAAADIRTMRQRLEASVGPDHLKRGTGGYVDIEFITQYLSLVTDQDPDEDDETNAYFGSGFSTRIARRGVVLSGFGAPGGGMTRRIISGAVGREGIGEHGELPIGYRTTAVLDRLVLIGRLPSDAATELNENLAVLRRLEGLARLTQGQTTSVLPADPLQRERFARYAGYPDAETMDSIIAQARQRNRHWFDHLIPV